MPSRLKYFKIFGVAFFLEIVNRKIRRLIFGISLIMVGKFTNNLFINQFLRHGFYAQSRMTSFEIGICPTLAGAVGGDLISACLQTCIKSNQNHHNKLQNNDLVKIKESTPFIPRQRGTLKTIWQLFNNKYRHYLLTVTFFFDIILRSKKLIPLLILCFITVSCIRTPTDNSPVQSLKANSGDILVLCEGLQGYDNTSLTLIKSASGVVLGEYFKTSNERELLGDTGNDIIRQGDTALIALSTSSIIRLIRISDGRRIKEISLPENCMPRKLALLSDSTACVTCLLKSSVYIFNFKNDSEIFEIPVGPQPEGIAVNGDMIFAANSAYGDFNYMHPDAGTVSIVSASSKKEIIKIKTGPNCSEVLISQKNNTFYAIYYDLPSQEDSTGGIIEFDLSNFNQLRNWKIRARNINLSQTGDSLVFISQMPKGSSMSEESGVSCIDLNSGKSSMIIKNPNRFDIWYGLSVSPFDGSIWVSNAKNHINNGGILVFSTDDFSRITKQFDVMLNPNKVLFVR